MSLQNTFCFAQLTTICFLKKYFLGWIENMVFFEVFMKKNLKMG